LKPLSYFHQKLLLFLEFYLLGDNSKLNISQINVTLLVSLQSGGDATHPSQSPRNFEYFITQNINLF
jgi:hypothetical protein